MLEIYAYPPDVAVARRRQWSAHDLPLPEPDALTSFIAGGYQASLRREEDHPVSTVPGIPTWAAYRLCQAAAGGPALVVSQGGGIRPVRQCAGQARFWNQLIL